MGFGADSVSDRRKVTGFRANSMRSGTTPAHDWAHYPGILEAVVERLRGVTIENREAIDIMRQHDSPETLHYLDPPYPHSTRSRPGGLCHNYVHEMTDEQHQALVDFLRGGLKGFIILSSYAHPIYEALGWKTLKRKAMADGAREREEVLYLCPRTANAIKQGELL